MNTMWWKQAVFYEIYIRSFQDSNGDGIGDLNGITGRLDYLVDLGVDAIWITPFYPSPQVDFGYDVSDHEQVDPQFGTLDDFDRLIREAHRRGLRVIVDVILNHTSDRHPWFVDSRASTTSPYRDWYIWRDGRGGGELPPNNWESAFGGPAWSRDAATGQWYYHFFYAEQPDLNWRNPAVEARMFETLRFWIERGVDGFRLDAVNTLFEDEALRDNPPLAAPKISLTGVRTQDFVQTRRLPEVQDALRRLRTFIDAIAPGTLLISEAYVDAVEDLVSFYGEPGRAGMHLPFNFFLAQVPALDAGGFRRAIEMTEAALGPERWPSHVLSNHDIARACDRLAGVGAGQTDAVARLLAVMLLTLRGSPFIYYGEEIGMRTEPPATLADVRDPVGRVFWPRYKGRDGVRRPMSWTSGAGAGFTTGAPWLGLAADAQRRNVAAGQRSEDSVWSGYRRLLTLRRHTSALQQGSYRGVPSAPGVLAYERIGGIEGNDETRVLVAMNMSDQRVHAGLDGACYTSRWTTAFSTHGGSANDTVQPADLMLAPFEGIVLLPTVSDRR